MKDTMKEPRPKILVVEDDPNDYELVKTIAIHYGLPINVTSTTAALQTIAGGQFSVIVLDLMLGGPNARDTVDTIAASGAERIPIIVTTGYDNPVLRDYCKSRGWAWISKSSPRFGRLLAESLNELTKSDGESDGEGSGSFSVRPSGGSQLETILAMLEKLQKSHAELKQAFGEYQHQVGQICRIVLGYTDEKGLHVQGCYESHQPLHRQVTQLRINAWHLVGLAVTVVVTSTVAALVASVIGR